MKKFTILALACVAMSLPACCCKKKSCCPEPTQQCEEGVVEKRVSGPLSEKNVQWDKEDYS